MADCDLCEREHVCDYQYKPCDCVGYRKFVPAPMTNCGACDGSGWNPYPLRCRECKGCGLVRQPDNGDVSAEAAGGEK